MKYTILVVALIAFALTARAQVPSAATSAQSAPVQGGVPLDSATGGFIITHCGMRLVANEGSAHFVLDFIGKDIRYKPDNPHQFVADGKFVEIQIVSRAQIGPDAMALNGEALLDRHMQWETNYIAEVNQWHRWQPPPPITITGRNLSAAKGWIMTPAAEFQANGVSVGKFIYITTVIGDRVLVIMSPVTTGQPCLPVFTWLADSLKSLHVSDTPISLTKEVEKAKQGVASNAPCEETPAASGSSDDVSTLHDNDKELHLISRLKANAVPLSPDRLSRRIQDAAIEYKTYAPISRVVFNDIAYPANKIETKLMRGYALLLITAFSQAPDELPLKRVFVMADGKSFDLKLLGAVSSETPEADVQVRVTFGRYRLDALYLLPISAAVQHGTLYADFAKNKAGFKLNDMEDPPDDPLKKWREAPKPGVQPDNKALTEMIRREYPGFLAE